MQVFACFNLILLMAMGLYLSVILNFESDTVLKKLLLICLIGTSCSFMTLGMIFGRLQRLTTASNMMCMAPTTIVRVICV